MQVDPNKQKIAQQETSRALQEEEQRRAAARLEKSFQDFLAGNTKVLFGAEITHSFAPFMLALHEEGDRETVERALKRLEDLLLDGERALRERGLMITSVFISRLVDIGESFYLQQISTMLVRWLKNEQEVISGFEHVCNQLEHLLIRLLEEGKWYETENLIVALYQISQGIIKKSNVISRLVSKMLAGVCEEEILYELLEAYIDPYTEEKDIAESLLTHLGSNATRFLFYNLIVEETRERRLLLIEIMPIGEGLLEVAEAELQAKPAWYVIRNIILVLSRGEGDSYWKIIGRYAGHPDMRVQQQVVNAAWKMGGEKLVERLLNVLLRVNDELKIALATQLNRMQHQGQVEECYIQLIDNRHNFARIIKNDLLFVLCEGLADVKTAAAARCLTELMHERKEEYGELDRVYQCALKSCTRMNKEYEGDDMLLFDDLDFELTFDDLVDETPAVDLQELSEYEEDDEDDEAFDEILSHTRADELDDAGREEHHFSVWSDFYDSLTNDDFQVFFRHLERRIYNPGETIADTTSPPALLLVDTGDVEVVFNTPGKNSYIRPLSGGDVVGKRQIQGEPWSFLLVARESVSIHMLSVESRAKLVDSHPHLIEMLETYAFVNDAVSSVFEVFQDLPAGMEQIVLENFRISSAPESSAVDGTVHAKFHGGMLLSTEYTENVQQLSGKLVEVLLCDEEQKSDKCYGIVGGYTQSEQAGDDSVDELLLFVKFYHPRSSSEYMCKSIKLL